MPMYEVCAKCGHVGRNHYVDKIFAVNAANGKEAAAKVRFFPRVKHHHKDAIRYLKPIDVARYAEILCGSHLDPFFQCHSIQEQRQRCSGILDVHFDTEAKRFREERAEPRSGRPRGKKKRVSSSELLCCYYKEVETVC